MTDRAVWCLWQSVECVRKSSACGTSGPISYRDNKMVYKYTMVGTYELGLFFCCCRAIAYRLENGLVNQIRICYLSIHLNLEARTLAVNKQRTQPLGNY